MSATDKRTGQMALSKTGGFSGDSYRLTCRQSSRCPASTSLGSPDERRENIPRRNRTAGRQSEGRRKGGHRPRQWKTRRTPEETNKSPRRIREVNKQHRQKYENSKRILHHPRIQRHNSQHRLDSPDTRRSAGAHQSPQVVIPRRLSEHVPDAGDLPAGAARAGQRRGWRHRGNRIIYGP